MRVALRRKQVRLQCDASADRNAATCADYELGRAWHAFALQIHRKSALTSNPSLHAQVTCRSVIASVDQTSLFRSFYSLQHDLDQRLGRLPLQEIATPKLLLEMPASLPGGSSPVLCGSCERQAAVRYHSNFTKARGVAGALEPNLRLRVRPPSASCQACTTSSTPGDGHQNGCSSSCFQSRVGPSGSCDASKNAIEGCEASSLLSDGASQPHLQGDRAQGHGVPAVASEPVGTVVICGWLGSNKRYLKRYQDWWTQNG